MAPKLGPIVAMTFFIQIYISMTANSPGIFAPVVAADLGVSAKLLGVFYWIFGAAAMFSTLTASGIIRRFGGARLLQCVVLLMGASLAIAGIGNLTTVVLCAVIMGLAVGPHVSAALHLIARAAPMQRLGLLASFTQAGGAIGVGLAGILIPQLMLAFEWEKTALIIGSGGVLFALIVQSFRKSLDDDRQPGHSISVSPRALVTPVISAMRNRVMREIMIAGFALSMLFQSLVGFIVSFLNLELGFSLVVAGIALTASQVSSLAARLFLGWLADRLRDPFAVLSGIGWGALASGVVMAFIGRDWSLWAICVAAAAYGITASGWVGACFAAMASTTAREQVASATSSLQFVMIFGGMMGPLIFAGLVSATGHYSYTYGAFALFGAVVGWRMMRLRRRLRRETAERMTT